MFIDLPVSKQPLSTVPAKKFKGSNIVWRDIIWLSTYGCSVYTNLKAEGVKEFFNDRAGQFAKEVSLRVSSLLEMRWLIDLFRMSL